MAHVLWTMPPSFWETPIHLTSLHVTEMYSQNTWPLCTHLHGLGTHTSQGSPFSCWTVLATGTFSRLSENLLFWKCYPWTSRLSSAAAQGKSISFGFWRKFPVVSWSFQLFIQKPLMELLSVCQRERVGDCLEMVPCLQAAGSFKWENQTHELDHSLIIWPKPQDSNTRVTGQG